MPMFMLYKTVIILNNLMIFMYLLFAHVKIIIAFTCCTEGCYCLNSKTLLLFK